MNISAFGSQITSDSDNTVVHNEKFSFAAKQRLLKDWRQDLSNKPQKDSSRLTSHINDKEIMSKCEHIHGISSFDDQQQYA